MTDTRLMYGAVGAGAEAILEDAPPPKSPAQAAAPYIAEFVGTFVLVFTVGCCLLAPGSPTWNATAIGCVLMVMIYSTGPISGGNLNPAVSFSLGLIGSLPWPVVIGYWIAQLTGGIAAGFCFCALFTPRTVQVEPGPPYPWVAAAGAEAIYTCLLCFVVNNVAASRRNNPKDDSNQFFALAIGFVIIAGGYAAGGISGACFNPAVSLGLDISSTKKATAWGLAWASAELIGAAAAAALFRAVRPEDFEPQEELATYEPTLFTRCTSEFLGTFVLVFTVGLNVTMASPAVAWSAAAALMCMIYSLGNVSGAHFNPAVTLAVVLSGRGKCSMGDGVAYIITQIFAGTCAGVAYAQFHAAGPNQDMTFGLQPGSGYGPGSAGVAELFFTFVLAYVVLSCATVAPPTSWKTKQNAYFALAIGSCVTAGGFAIGAVSGGELNPAVSIGIATASASHHGMATPPPFMNCITFSFWELVGGILAAATFRQTHPEEFRKVPLLGK